ncbi:MAG: ATP-binding protein [Gammaproteobacteria bacterium]|nr:ATP-binding protein [Gammaproteobacteria bacterium]MCI0590835.1 ATP-binding protein [Gammaproteobacteria bacterium]
MIKSEEARRLFDHLTTAVLMFDRELRLVAINTSGEDLLSVSARHVVGLKAQEIWPDAPMFTGTLERSSATQEPLIERGMHLQLALGKAVTVDYTVTPVNDEEAPMELLVELINADVRRRIAREEALITQHEAVRALVRGMAHEIKNPLGGLRGAAQLLGRELNNAALAEYTRIIIGEADRLQRLVDRMLAPHSLPKKRSVNIHEVLEYLCSLVEAEITAEVRIVRDYDPSLPELQADREQLIQALLNIMRNAVEAVGASGEITLRTRPERQITIGQKRYKLVIRLDVIDNGPGIPPEIEHGIFYPMVTGRANGTGLGLPIAQMLIQLHGGLIEFDSQPGETVFTVWLPLERENG